MKNIIFACEILDDEIKKALHETGNHDPVIWFDSSLHMYPQKLHDRLQAEIDGLDQQDLYENILFTFGYCGNAIAGLKSLKSNLIIPKVNDCIDLFLHDNPERAAIRSQGCYFLTHGWLKSPHSIVNEYQHYIEKYGIKKTTRIMDVMLAHYHFFTMIDTESYKLDECALIVKEAAKELNLQVNTQKGSIQLLVDLFSNRWSDDFCLISPGETVSLEHFGEISTVPSQGQII